METLTDGSETALDTRNKPFWAQGEKMANSMLLTTIAREFGVLDDYMDAVGHHMNQRQTSQFLSDDAKRAITPANRNNYSQNLIARGVYANHTASPDHSGTNMIQQSMPESGNYTSATSFGAPHQFSASSPASRQIPAVGGTISTQKLVANPNAPHGDLSTFHTDFKAPNQLTPDQMLQLYGQKMTGGAFMEQAYNSLINQQTGSIPIDQYTVQQFDNGQTYIFHPHYAFTMTPNATGTPTTLDT